MQEILDVVGSGANVIAAGCAVFAIIVTHNQDALILKLQKRRT